MSTWWNVKETHSEYWYQWWKCFGNGSYFCATYRLRLKWRYGGASLKLLWISSSIFFLVAFFFLNDHTYKKENHKGDKYLIVFSFSLDHFKFYFLGNSRTRYIRIKITKYQCVYWHRPQDMLIFSDVDMNLLGPWQILDGCRNKKPKFEYIISPSCKEKIGACTTSGSVRWFCSLNWPILSIWSGHACLVN